MPDKAPYERRPAIWRIVGQTAGAVDFVVLGDTPNDSYRIGITIVGNGDDGPEVESCVFYPCRTCGWAMACAGGEDCHS